MQKKEHMSDSRRNSEYVTRKSTRDEAAAIDVSGWENKDVEPSVHSIAMDLAKNAGRDPFDWTEDDWNKAIKIYRNRFEKGVPVPEMKYGNTAAKKSKNEDAERSLAAQELLTLEEQARRKYSPPEMRPEKLQLKETIGYRGRELAESIKNRTKK